MILKRRLLIVCTVSVILLLIVQHCDAARKTGGSSKSSSGRGSTSGRGTSSSSGGSWWSKVTGGGSSSSSSSSSSASKVSSSATQRKPEPSAPRLEEKKPIGWNVPGVNSNPGAPPPYSNTHTKGLSNPNLQNAPKYSQNSPPGHQTIQSNYNPNQYAGLNYPRNTGQQSPGYPVQSNVQGQYPGINYPKNVGQQQSGYPGGTYQGGHYANQGGHYPNQGGYYQNTGGHYPNQGGHYSGMNYGGGSYPGYSGYSPAAPNGYFASGYPVTILSSSPQRSSSGNTLTNTLLAGSLGLGLYNAIRPYPSYSGTNYGSYGGGGSTVHNHYYNSQAPGSNSAQAPIQNPAQAPVQAQAVPSNQNAVQTPLAPMPDQAGVPLANSNAADPTNALVTPPPPTLAPNDKITDLDCVYAMKILNCSEIPQCPQEWMHPSCLNRTISKEYFDSITLPPPPPMPEASQVQQQPLSGPSEINQNKNGERNLNVYSNGQQMPVVSPSSSSNKASAVGYSLCLAIFFGMGILKSAF